MSIYQYNRKIGKGEVYIKEFIMKFSLISRSAFALSLVSVFLIGCGGGGGSSSSSGSGSSAASGVLVDPFISGAVLCEDVDKNGSCDSSEQLSSATDAEGKFSFSNPLTPGSHIIVQKQGFHNGVPYTLDLGGVVDANASAKVISPLTTLQTKQLSAVQIKTLLHNAGLTNVTDDDIFANPLDGGIESLVDDNSLRRLQATLATYGMLKVLEGSNTLRDLNATNLMNSPEVASILSVMVSTIKTTLSKNTLDTIQTQVSSYNQAGLFTAPNVSIGVVASTAVTMIDALTKTAYDTCNQTDGTDTQKVTAALAQFNTQKTAILAKQSELGMRYYGAENSSVFNAIPAQYQSLIPQAIKDGISGRSSAVVLSGTDFNISGQGTDVANMVLEAYADSDAPALATFVTTCPNSDSDQPYYAAGLDCDGDNGVVAFETPRKFKVAFKSLALVNQAGDKKYLFNKATLAESVVFDISEPKILGDLIIPQGVYTKIEAEIYYYWLDMQMYNEGEYTQFRVYMSDDNPTHATAGHHQGDVTLTDVNNVEQGWLDAGGLWKAANSIATRVEPLDPDAPLYAATKDPDTNRQRGPFGTSTLWDDNSANPNDIYTMSQPISSLNLTKESKIKLTFNVKNNWYWEDYNGDGIFGAAMHKNSENNITEAADGNATWAPLLGLPTITKVY